MVQTQANDATASSSTESPASRIAKEIETGANAHAAEEISKLKQTNPAEYQKVVAAANKEVASYNSAHNTHLPALEIVGDKQVKVGNDTYTVGSKNGNPTLTDAHGNVTEFKTSGGQETSVTTDKNNKARESDQYNADGSIKSETYYQADGKTQAGKVEIKYDADGRPTGYDRTDYGADGKTVTAKTHGEGHYDANGHLISEDETRYSADGKTVTGKTHTEFHNDANGNRTSSDSTEYGADGKTITGYKHVTEHNDSNGKLISEDESSYQADGKTRSSVSHTEYDSNGNPTSEAKAEFQADGKTPRTESQTEYDANGDVKTRHEKTFNDTGDLVQRSDIANGQTTVTDIDPDSGKATGYTRVNKDGTETHYAADGKTKTSETKYKYDATGQQISSEETDYGADGKVTGYVNTQYDENGNPKTESSYSVGKDGKRIPREVKSYEYDSDGSAKGYYDQYYDHAGKPTVRPYVEAADSN